MPRLQLNGQQTLWVPKRIVGALWIARIDHASAIAQVLGGDRKPALLLICADELVLVGSPKGAQRWPVSQVAEVRPGSILMQDGAWAAPAPLDAGRFARIVAVLAALVSLCLVVSLLSFYGHVYRGWVIGSCLVVVSLMALPLLVCSIRLARVRSSWQDLGVAGVVVGLLATLVPVAGVVLAATYG